MNRTVVHIGAAALVTVYAAAAVLCAVFLVWVASVAWAIHQL